MESVGQPLTYVSEDERMRGWMDQVVYIHDSFSHLMDIDWPRYRRLSAMVDYYLNNPGRGVTFKLVTEYGEIRDYGTTVH